MLARESFGSRTLLLLSVETGVLYRSRLFVVYWTQLCRDGLRSLRRPIVEQALWVTCTSFQTFPFS